MNGEISPRKVMQALTDLPGVPSMDDFSLLPFCETAALSLSPRLKEEGLADHPLVLSAAAAAAYHQLCLSDFLAGGGVSVFSAGDLSCTTRGEDLLKTAGILKEQAMAAAAPFLTDEGFYFSARG